MINFILTRIVWLKKFFGYPLSLVPTIACNYRCSYCIWKCVNGEYPKKTAVYSADEWIKFVSEYPIKISEIVITGGEPTLYPEIVKLVNWLTKNKYLVRFYTNLSMPEVILKFNRSPFLKIQASYHKKNKVQFIQNYQVIKDGYNVIVEEVETGELEFSNVKPLQKAKYAKKPSYAHVGPDFKVVLSCYDLFKNYA